MIPLLYQFLREYIRLKFHYDPDATMPSVPLRIEMAVATAATVTLSRGAPPSSPYDRPPPPSNDPASVAVVVAAIILVAAARAWRQRPVQCTQRPRRQSCGGVQRWSLVFHPPRTPRAGHGQRAEGVARSWPGHGWFPPTVCSFERTQLFNISYFSQISDFNQHILLVLTPQNGWKTLFRTYFGHSTNVTN